MQDKILEIIKNKGPVVPSELTKQLSTDTMFIGAYLSELVASKKLIVTKLKIGSSPLYYLDGQQAKLQDYAKNLNEKDREAYELLKKEGVVKDKSQTPIIRVALRSIPDFSVQLTVKAASGEKETFWKWYLLTDKEAEAIIKKHFEEETPKENIQTAQQKFPVSAKPTEEKKQKEEKEKSMEEMRKQLDEEKEQIKEERQKLDEEKKKIEKEKTPKKQKQKEPTQKTEEQKTLKKETEKKDAEDTFLTRIKEFCKQKNIEVIETTIIKKKTEIELILNIPSIVGQVKYYCKAKDKKKVGEGDLSSALVKGQMKKLPTLFLSTGELTTKAKKELDNELKNQVIFQKI